jgi:hypothetical protein
MGKCISWGGGSRFWGITEYSIFGIGGVRPGGLSDVGGSQKILIIWIGGVEPSGDQLPLAHDPIWISSALNHDIIQNVVGLWKANQHSSKDNYIIYLFQHCF